MRLRLRGPTGVANCSFTEQATVADLLAEAAKVAQADGFTLLAGFPPAPLVLDPTSKLCDVVQNGDTLTVGPPCQTSALAPATSATTLTSVQNGDTLHAHPATSAALPPALAAPSSPGPASAQLSAAARDEDEDLRLALALSRGEDVTAAATPPAEAAPPAEGEERIVRRVIPADNSCLFAAVAYALEGGAACPQAKTMELRQHVASVVRAGVAAGDERFSEAMLGREPLEYASWIADKEHWGGATELDLLSERYATELAAIDVKTGAPPRPHALPKRAATRSAGEWMGVEVVPLSFARVCVPRMSVPTSVPRAHGRFTAACSRAPPCPVLRGGSRGGGRLCP